MTEKEQLDLDLTDVQAERLSDLCLSEVRRIDDEWLKPYNGWTNITTGSMRMITDDLLRDIITTYRKFIRQNNE